MVSELAPGPSVHKLYLGDLGFYATLGDAESMAREILALIDDPGERESRGRALRARAVSGYSWEEAGQKLVALYRELLDGRL